MEEKKDTLSSQEMLKIDRYLWIARAFSAVAILAFVVNVLLFSAIGSLYPLIRIQPFYLTILDKNQQVIDIRPIGAGKLYDRTTIEAFVRQYVLARYEVTPDIQEVEERWGVNGIVALMSAQSVYDEFAEIANDMLQKNIKEKGMRVQASITSASAIPNSENLVWNVYVKLTQSTDAADDEIINLKVSLQVQFDPLMQEAYRTTWQDRLKNPLGFRVMMYGEDFAEEKKGEEI